MILIFSVANTCVPEYKIMSVVAKNMDENLYILEIFLNHLN